MLRFSFPVISVLVLLLSLVVGGELATDAVDLEEQRGVRRRQKVDLIQLDVKSPYHEGTWIGWEEDDLAPDSDVKEFFTRILHFSTSEVGKGKGKGKGKGGDGGKGGKGANGKGKGKNMVKKAQEGKGREVPL